jgi:hypothetical protein
MVDGGLGAQEAAFGRVSFDSPPLAPAVKSPGKPALASPAESPPPVSGNSPPCLACRSAAGFVPPRHPHARLDSLARCASPSTMRLRPTGPPPSSNGQPSTKSRLHVASACLTSSSLHLPAYSPGRHRGEFLPLTAIAGWLRISGMRRVRISGTYKRFRLPGIFRYLAGRTSLSPSLRAGVRAASSKVDEGEKLACRQV